MILDAADVLFIAFMAGGAGWALAYDVGYSRGRALTEAGAAAIGAALGRRVAEQHGTAIALGDTIIEATRRRALNLMFAPEGYSVQTAFLYQLDGKTWRAEISEAAQ